MRAANKQLIRAMLCWVHPRGCNYIMRAPWVFAYIYIPITYVHIVYTIRSSIVLLSGIYMRIARLLSYKRARDYIYIYRGVNLSATPCNYRGYRCVKCPYPRARASKEQLYKCSHTLSHSLWPLLYASLARNSHSSLCGREWETMILRRPFWCEKWSILGVRMRE